MPLERTTLPKKDALDHIEHAIDHDNHYADSVRPDHVNPYDNPYEPNPSEAQRTLYNPFHPERSAGLPTHGFPESWFVSDLEQRSYPFSYDNDLLPGELPLDFDPRTTRTETSCHGDRREKIDIISIQPTAEHLQAERLYSRDFAWPGGMEEMKREHPRQARLRQEINAMSLRGTPEQQAAIQALRAQRGKPFAPSIDIEGKQPTLAHLQAERLYSRDFAWTGGMEKMKQMHPRQARLQQEIKAMRFRGTPEQQAAIQALREKQKNKS